MLHRVVARIQDELFASAGGGVERRLDRGVCNGRSKCVAPAGSFVRATTSEVDTWSATVTKTISVTVPDHDSKFIATRFEARVDGATGTQGVCTFLLFDTSVAGKMAVDVTATATGWGRCTTPACTPKPVAVTVLRVSI